MITIENGHRTQTASEGILLTNGESFSKIVYLGDGAPEWQEVPDNGQLDPIVAEVVE